jgi:hypothetical protein
MVVTSALMVAARCRIMVKRSCAWYCVTGLGNVCVLLSFLTALCAAFSLSSSQTSHSTARWHYMRMCIEFLTLCSERSQPWFDLAQRVRKLCAHVHAAWNLSHALCGRDQAYSS